MTTLNLAATTTPLAALDTDEHGNWVLTLPDGERRQLNAHRHTRAAAEAGHLLFSLGYQLIGGWVWDAGAAMAGVRRVSRHYASLSPAAILHGARDLIRRYGFWRGGFGAYNIGFSLEGAIYEIAAFRIDDLNLRDADTPEDHARWNAAVEAIQAIARTLGEQRPSRAPGRVYDTSERLNAAQADALLLRTLGEQFEGELVRARGGERVSA
ncbi:DUF6197 family protein [Rhizomonospora bruguierae]|uniref:DUF6197 family protein n=1 Tax=Rhizomonospora bruguierae TaxID=1581705 RepID=UPI001BD0E4D8|nr:hypothetical protein [Micromonospora sp. NBRC 107566]